MTVKRDPLNMANEDYGQLNRFIDNLRTGINQSLEQADEMADLVAAFQNVADAYFIKAQSLKEIYKPQEQSHFYFQVLSRLREHSLLLGDLIRFYPVKIFATNRRRFFQQAFTLLSRRLNVVDEQNPPLLLPILAQSFRYSHFRYMDGFGFIGIPPSISLSQANDQTQQDLRHLSVLWHEVAGHAIAVARETQLDLLKEWAMDSSDRLKPGGLFGALNKANQWEKYRELYRQSILFHLPKRPELTAIGIFKDIEELYTTHILKNSIIDDNIDWQVTWLLEFLEDLFLITAIDNEPPELGRTVLETMFEALIMRYPNPAVGDPLHPPPNLRLLVAIAHLSRSSDTRKDYMTRMSHDFPISPDLDDLAIAISDFCREQIIASNALFDSQVSEKEKAFARLILNPNSTETELKRVLEDINLEMSNYKDISEQFTENEIKPIKEAGDLLNFKFNYDDPNNSSVTGGPSGISSSSPPPPPTSGPF